jgi:hypothetical protein
MVDVVSKVYVASEVRVSAGGQHLRWPRGPALLAVALLSAALFATGCSGDDDKDPNAPSISNLKPGQLCAKIAIDQCTKAHACPNANQANQFGYGQDEGSCQGTLFEKYGCTSSTATQVCKGGASSTATASACVDAIAKATCEQVLSATHVPGCSPCNP